MSEAVIYALCDPATGLIRYVGAARDAERRYRQHISDSRKAGIPRIRCDAWVRELDRQGLKPSLIVLETVTDASWQERERHWIATVRCATPGLLNVGPGGNGHLSTRDPALDDRSVATIYGLWDPVTGALRYVGKTTMPLKARLSAHCNAHTRGKPNRVAAWVNDLHRAGYRPVMRAVDAVPADMGDVAERAWIGDLLANGADLLNSNRGGTGLDHTDPERRNAVNKKISAAKTGVPRPAFVGEGNPNAKLTAELVREIRQRAHAGEALNRIAKSVGIHEDTVSKVVIGRLRPEDGGPVRKPTRRKLVERDVVAIRERVAGGERRAALAAEYGVTSGHITQVVTGALWRNAAGPRIAAIKRVNLTEQQVRDVRARFAAGESQPSLAAEYDVHRSTIQLACVAGRRFATV